MSMLFNVICINEEMLPKYTRVCVCIYIYIYIYTHIHKKIQLFNDIYIYIYRYIYMRLAERIHSLTQVLAEF